MNESGKRNVRSSWKKSRVGDETEGTVRSIKDFGVFVDLGGLDGLIHISKLSWERVKHPSEVLEEGQKVKVKIDKIDEATGKISLSYRDLLENPWNAAEADFSVGSIHKGIVTSDGYLWLLRSPCAWSGGLVHVSELAHHRVSKVDAFVQQDNEVEVKVLSFDRETQKISLSIKAAQQTAAAAIQASEKEEEVEEPQREVAVAQHDGPLRGGNNRDTGGAAVRTSLVNRAGEIDQDKQKSVSAASRKRLFFDFRRSAVLFHRVQHWITLLSNALPDSINQEAVSNTWVTPLVAIDAVLFLESSAIYSRRVVSKPGFIILNTTPL